jgi:hypothetical protein
MDPYLEQSNLWPNVHNSLITALRDFLAPRLRPRYFVAVQERSYFEDPLGVAFTTIPDTGIIGPLAKQPLRTPGVALAPSPAQTINLVMPERIRETYLEVIEIGGVSSTAPAQNGDTYSPRVVTLVEILSPWNKQGGDGRIQYSRKRTQIIGSATNLVEIDLLRSGRRFSDLPNQRYDYSILVSPARLRPAAHFYAFTLREPIPTFVLPLQAEDDEPPVDLNTLLHDLYDRAGYDLRINYRTAPEPPLTDEDATWLEDRLRGAGIR